MNLPDSPSLVFDTFSDGSHNVKVFFLLTILFSLQRAQTGIWPTPSITLGTGKPKGDLQSLPSSYKSGDGRGEIKPEEKMSQVRKALLIEPHHDKTCLEFLTRSDTNRAVQPQKMARGY